jgi:hypothetical protein
VKHSDAGFVCVLDAYDASPEYSTGQQYLPSVLVFVAEADVAVPPHSATAPPICVPADPP